MMHLLRPWLVLACLAVGLSSAWAETWKPLFNGKDLTGWETFLVPAKPKAGEAATQPEMGLNRDPLHVFSVVEVDGRPAIRISGEVWGTLTTLDSFSNYHLRLQFKWGEKKWGAADKPRGSGLLYHGHGNHGDADTGKRWLHTQQFQIQEGTCGEYVSVGDVIADIHARVLDEKRRIYDPKAGVMTFSAKSPMGVRCTRQTLEEKPTGEWNVLDLICVGDRSVHIVNGQLALMLANSRKSSDGDKTEPLTAGRLQLQCEGSELFFRDIEITPLEKMPEEWSGP